MNPPPYGTQLLMEFLHILRDGSKFTWYPGLDHRKGAKTHRLYCAPTCLYLKNLLEFLKDMTRINNGHSVDVMLLGFSRTFDKVPHVRITAMEV